MHEQLYKIFTSGKRDSLDPTTKYLVQVLFYAVIAVAFIIASLLVFDVIGHGGAGATSFNLGTFGDFFGGVLNPFLTFLTVLGLAVTIIMQRIGVGASRLQRFETTFFNLLDLQNKIIEGLGFAPSILHDNDEMLYLQRVLPELEPKTQEFVKGREVFAAVLKRIASVACSTRSRVAVYRDELQAQHNYVLGHYFRNLYQILRLVDRLEDEFIDDATIRTYTGIVRAQLSANELALLFYNCLGQTVDKGEFKTLVVKYRLLEHLPLRYDKSSNELRGDFLPEEFKYFREYLASAPPDEPEPTSGNYRIPGPYVPGAYGTNPAVREYLIDTQPPILPRKS
jgi:hypothetical protein